MAKLKFYMIGHERNFAFRFGEIGPNWYEVLSINRQELERKVLNFTDVTNPYLRKVYFNFCRRMNMKANG